ncbi:MAG: sigma 54-interacting transcriptional regulator [Acetobacteraceae bacterium]
MLTGRESIIAAVGLFDLVSTIASERDRDSVATRCLAAACRLANAKAGVLYALDNTGARMVPVATLPAGLTNPTDGTLTLYPGGKPDMSDPRTWTAFSGKPVLMPNAGAVAGFQMDAIRRRDHLTRTRTESILTCPLRSNDDVTVGVLELINVRAPDGTPATKDDLETLEPLLRAFAYQAAIIISNIALLERNRALVAELDANNQHLTRENRRLREQTISVASRANGLIAQSPAMKSVLELVGKVADSHVTVLVLGETGTGKEVISRLLHATSGRRDKPFIAQNCAAMPADLLESELFGHRKGAFTGAIADKQGLFAAADGGVLFLDEIGDLPLGLQSKLLRVLQDGEVRPLGATTGQRHDVRVIAATNVDLKSRVADGRFREDLFYRISVFPIVLPPLRQRPDDIAALAEHFLAEFRQHRGTPTIRITPEAQTLLRQYPFPGNVRELRNIMERAAILAPPGAPISIEDLPPELVPGQPSDSPAAAAAPTAAVGMASFDTDPGLLRNDMQRFEARAIAQALESNGGNRTRAARALGLSRRTLQEKISRYGLGGRADAHHDDGGGPS